MTKNVNDSRCFLSGNQLSGDGLLSASLINHSLYLAEEERTGVRICMEKHQFGRKGGRTRSG